MIDMDKLAPLPTTITPLIVLCRTQGIGRVMAQELIDRMTDEQRQGVVTAYHHGNLPAINAIREAAGKQDPPQPPAEAGEP